MKYKIQNTRMLSPTELLTILCKSAKLYSEYADTTLLFIFREKKSDVYDYYEVRYGKNNQEEIQILCMQKQLLWNRC